MFLARRNLTAHPLRSLLTALAIALGVAMVLAAAVIGQAASEQANTLADASGPRIDLEVFARDQKPFAENTLAVVRANAGVEIASASLSLEASVSNLQSPISFSLLGVDPAAYQALHKPKLADGTFLAADNTMVVPTALAVRNGWRTGDALQLGVSDRVAHVTLGGRLKSETGIALGAAPAALVPLAIAQQLADAAGQIDRIEIQLRAGTDVETTRAELASALGAGFAVAQVVVGGGPSFSTLTLQALLALVGVIILFAAGFVIANAFGMSVTARLKEFGALRTLGLTRRGVLTLVLLEAGGLGMVGAVGGVLLGLGLAWVTLAVIGYDTALNVPLWAMVFSPVMGLTITLLSALLPAWQASRISPMEAVKSEGTQKDSPTRGVLPRLGGLALVVIIVGLGIFSVVGRPDIATGLVVLLPSMVVLLAAMALLMPALVAPVATLVQPLLRRWPGGTAGRLAADNLRRNPTRAALTAAAMTAGLTMIIATSGLIPTFFKGGLKVFTAQVHLDRAIWPMVAPDELRFDNLMEAFLDAPPLNPEMVTRLQALEQGGTTELIDYDIARVPPELGAMPQYFGVFVEPEAFIRSGDFNFIEGNPADALKLMQRGRAVLIAPTVAARFNVHVGDDVKVQTPKGEVAFTVAGIGGVWIVMPVFPYADGQTYFGVGEPTMLGIVAKAGPNKAATLQQVDTIVKDYSVFALNPADGFTIFDQAFDQLVLVLNALLLMAVVVAGLGVVNTLVISVTERKREIGMLRAIGATQRQVRQMVMAEGATLGLLSVIFAIGLSLIILVAFALLVGNNGMASLGIGYSGQQWVDSLSGALREMSKAALACLFIAPLVAALAAYWPAKQAAAMDVMDATRSVRVGLVPTQSLREEGEPERDLPTSFTFFLLARVIQEQRTRFLLSVLAVAIGVATTIASDYVGSGIIAVIFQNEDIHTLMSSMGEIAGWIKMVGVSVSLAVGFLIFNTFAMSFTQRRQQLGTLRTLGTTRAQIIRLALAEAALIGVLGMGVGIVAGQLMGRGFIAFMRATSDLINTFVERDTSLGTYALAIGLGLGVPLLAMLVPALNAARVSPLVALKAPEPTQHGIRKTRPFYFLLFTPLLLLLRPPNLAPPNDMYGVIVLSAVWLGLLALALPAALEAFAALSRIFLQRAGATGLLMADNLRRAQARTLITAVTLTVGITLIITLTGAIFFYAQELVRPKFEAVSAQRIGIVTTFDMGAMMSAMTPDISLRLLPSDIADLQTEFGGRAFILPTGFVNVPELSAMGDATASFVMSPAALRDRFQATFTFAEGDWEHAFPLMENGCGVLVAPYVAKRNHAQLYDTLMVTSPLGKKVPCVIAGIGELVSGVSIIGEAAYADFDTGAPFFLYMQALPGHDPTALFTDLETFANPRGLHLIQVDDLSLVILEMFDLIPVMFNGLLFFAVLAAALGVFNTTLIGLHERRRELGQLRAVGMTRRQATWVVVGEALLIGVFGAGLSLIAGAGFIFIIVLTFGGNSMGIADFPIYAATFRTLRAGMVNGLAALVMSPLLCALAAYLPARAMLRGAAIDTLNPEQTQPLTRQRLAGVFNRGSIQTRFVFGTALLLFIVLASLIQVVVGHARNFLVNNLRDTAAGMVGWNAAMIEATLPADAQTIDLDQLAQAQGQNFDADALLRFRSLIDDMTAGGLKEFVLADRDNVVVISFDQRDMGETLDPLEDTQKTTAREIIVEGDDVPQVSATAPLHNRAGDLVGSLRMTLRFEEIQIFLNRVRTTLWALGGVILALGLVASYLLSLPFTRAARSLATHAARITSGNYSPIVTQFSNSPISNLSIRTRLTLLMTLLVILLVSLMGLVVIPIERDELDRTTRIGVLTTIQWMGNFISESLPTDLSDLQNFDLARALTTVQNLDFARLQALTEQTRANGLTYLTIADTTGTIILSDKFALQGELGLTAARAQISEGEWQGEKIVIGSTPLTQGRDGEQIGTLSVAFSNTQIETFLTEAQNLFWLAGLIAVLAGLLLAQALGGAVAAPAEALTLGARRVAQGDLSVKFGTRVTGDELSQLAHAFNQMAAGLREREKLRDLFGKYVSPEVREAIESGRVTLTGERKTITCLYVDMRGSTAFADQHQPEEVMAALNEYFTVIILAVETYGGIVNRFVGDEAVCVFGAPTELNDHAEAALNAALAMRHGLAYLNEKRATRNLPTLKFGMGLNTGLVIAGATGSEERQEYTVIGDAMNVGARIEQLNKTFPDHDILLSEFTRVALGERAAEYTFIDLGEAEIRGKSKAVRVFGLARSQA